MSASAAPSAVAVLDDRPAASPAATPVRDLVVEHWNEILAAARTMSRCVADAEDLAQDAVVRALRFAGQFTPGTNFGAWMRTIVRNTAINRTRRERQGPATAGSEAAEFALLETPARPESPSGEGFDAVVVDRDALSAPLVRALDQLPRGHRDVLLLWAVGGYKYREIAEIAGCPIGTVMSRLHRARAILRRELSGSMDETLGVVE